MMHIGNTKTVTFPVTKKDFNRLKLLAKSQNISVSQLVEKWVKDKTDETYTT